MKLTASVDMFAKQTFQEKDHGNGKGSAQKDYGNGKGSAQKDNALLKTQLRL